MAELPTGTTKQPEGGVEHDDDSLNWVKIVKGDPKAQEGDYNPYRKSLLKPGVFVYLSPATAESWIPELRIRRRTAEQAAAAQGNPAQEVYENVKVTIVDIPEDTKTNAVDGKIRVRADVGGIDGVEADIFCSVFYNCIHGRDMAPDIVMTSGFVGFRDGEDSQPSGGWG